MNALCKAMYLQLYRELKSIFSLIAITIIAPFLLISQLIKSGTDRIKMSSTVIILMLASILIVSFCIFALIGLG